MLYNKSFMNGQMSHSELTNAALQYAKDNISIIPVSNDKAPTTKTWKENQEQIPSDEQIKIDFSSINVGGIATVCGAVSGGLEGIDIDCKNDLTGNLYACLTGKIKEEMPGLVDRLRIICTVNNGYHFLY